MVQLKRPARPAEEPQPEDGVGRARAEVERLAATELEWSQRLREQQTALRDLEAQAGRATLDAPDNVLEAGRVQAERIRTLETDIASSRRAIVAARGARVPAITAYWQAEAARLWVQADEAEADATALDAQAEPLIAQLQDLMGVAFVPIGESLAVQGRAMARRLRQNAQQTQHVTIVDRGEETATGIESLLAQVGHDALRLAPTMESVLAWAEAAATDLRRRYPDVALDAAQLTFHVAWEHGELVPTASRCSPPPWPESPNPSAGWFATTTANGWQRVTLP